MEGRIFLTPTAAEQYRYPRASGDYDRDRAAGLINAGTHRRATQIEITRFLAFMKGDVHDFERSRSAR